MASELRVFAYGTLKKGFSNHGAYCADVLQIRPAWVYGRLYKLSPELPVLIVPTQSVLALGTAGVANDIEVQQRIKPGPPAKSVTALDSPAWKKVQGELLLFDDPEIRLPLLDDLEEFLPGGGSTYVRVLVSVNLPGGLQATAWTYIGACEPASLEEIEGESWV